MKSFFILTVFSLILLDIIQVNGQCFDLIHQYNQCKHLKMEKTKRNLSEKYEPKKLERERNKLTDRFYRKLNSSEMNFDKAMKLFRTIYTEINNCTSEFCECVSLGIIDDSKANYSMYFRDKNFFQHSKSIIEAFNKKFESNLLPLEYLGYQTEFSSLYIPSLAQFCINHDYSKNRLNYYRNSFTCEPTTMSVMDLIVKII